MTRINLVAPTELTQKHLLAEYRELPRIFTLIKKAQAAGKTIDDYDLPTEYTMGRGHVIFFYNKTRFLIERYRRLEVELRRRGYLTNSAMVDRICKTAYNEMPKWAVEQTAYSWRPSPEEVYTNMARLVERHFK